MQTTNRHAPDYCGCVEHGQVSPHSSHAQCSANRAATSAMLQQQTSAAISGTIERGERLAAKHDSHYRPEYGCPLCPMSNAFYRRHDGSFGLPVEAAIPA